MLVLMLLMLRNVNGILQDNGHPSRNERYFPENFLLGAATSAYQIEGGWNADGKGESMWDHYVHKQPNIVEGLSNGDIAANSYNLYERDVQILKHLGAKSYRFSISWTRILPDGTITRLNPHGIAYYRRLIDLLLANNILPFVTIYHWDLPITLSNQGGWLNETTVDFFGEYARVLFREFGNKVKHWLTVNEPFIHCSFSYGIGIHPPLIKSPGVGFYECGRNMLLAHARAYHIYDTEFRELQGGKVGLALDAEWPLAVSHSKEDAEAVKDYIAFQLGQYMDPIFKGDYPQRMTDRIARASQCQGYTSSRLRPLSEDQKTYIKGTADFVGINHYYSLYVYRNESVRNMFEKPSFEDDAGFGDFSDSSWPQSASTRMTEYAPGFYSILMYLKKTYENPVIYVSETGFPTTSADDLNDEKKGNYLRNYLNALLDAIAAGSNCQGYFFWSLMDGLEWTSGYDKFSISWTRILPDGTITRLNPHGIAYYRRLIDLLLANNILPFVTIYHWDLPITLSNQGGWLNETTVDFFGEYARVLFREFGNKVKHWLTVNEPFIHCSFSYEIGIHPPLIKSPGVGFYECGRNMLLAHARAYHIYDTEFRELQGGKVGLALDAEWPLAASHSKEDAEAVKDYIAFQLGQYMDPIFKGDYPQRMTDRIARASQCQGYTSSRLRPLSEDQKTYIKGTADFVGINHYYSLYVYRNESVRNMFDKPSFEDDAGFGDFSDSSWPQSASTRMTEYAPGFYSILMYLKKTYENPVIYVSETGFPTTSADDLNDEKKGNYLRNYLNALLDAIAAGSNCQGYFFWSLMDGLEWTSGYDKYKFGLYKVDYRDPHRTRTSRKSALIYKKIIRTGAIDFEYNPDPYQYNRATPVVAGPSAGTSSCSVVAVDGLREGAKYSHHAPMGANVWPLTRWRHRGVNWDIPKFYNVW